MGTFALKLIIYCIIFHFSETTLPPYHVPGVLDDASFLRQYLNKTLSFSLTEHHASDGGHQSLVGQIQGRFCRIHCCR